MARRFILLALSIWMATLTGTAPRFASAQSAPASEKQKIEILIRHIGELKDANFVRNGSTYGPATAVHFLRAKWKANDAEIRSALEFIDKVASISGTSGKPYLIQFKDGREITSRDFLLEELNKLDRN
jgi:hypothetical protein